jgi:hypothetical protein
MSEDTPQRAFPGARMRPTRGVRRLYALIAALVALVAGTGALGGEELRGIMLQLTAIFALPLAIAAALIRKYTVRGGARLEVGADGVHVDGRLAIPRASIERADVVRGSDGVTVAIRRRHGFVAVISVADVAEGHALVRALGHSAEQALSVFQLDSPIASPLRWWVFYALLFVPAAAVVALGPALLTALPFAYAALLAGFVPTRLTIGLDGVLVRWMGLRELVPFAELRGVDHDGERLCLHLASGQARRFSVRWVGVATTGEKGSDATGFATRAAYLDAVVARVREAVAASGRAGGVGGAALLRRGRDLSTWVSALRGLLARGPAGFREGETPPEKLWSTLEDGAASPEARAAAAIALQPSLDDADRARMARVARVVVAPKLRVALDAVAEGDDARMLEALAEIEAAAGEREKRRA